MNITIAAVPKIATNPTGSSNGAIEYTSKLPKG
jgi:hypothetical protein